jgi:hypothetical protein
MSSLRRDTLAEIRINAVQLLNQLLNSTLVVPIHALKSQYSHAPFHANYAHTDANVPVPTSAES